MRHSDFFCHACKSPFSKTLTPTEYQAGKVVSPHYYRTPRSSMISSDGLSSSTARCEVGQAYYESTIWLTVRRRMREEFTYQIPTGRLP
jgi:hypothetical protein